MLWGIITPYFFQFKGGKGIATSAAVIFMLDWRLGLIVLASALLVMVLTRYISLGSIFGGIVFPVSAIIFTILIDKDYNYALILTAVIMGVLAIYRHHANISRLMYGTGIAARRQKKANKGGGDALKIAVIGSGSWGTAVSSLLASKSFDVWLWSWRLEETNALMRDRENKIFCPAYR